MIKIEHANMPSFLDDRDFQNWVDKFKIINITHIDEFKNLLHTRQRLSVAFSTKIVKTKYGSLTIDDIKSKILRKWKTNKHVLSVLLEIRSKVDLLERSEQLACVLSELDNRPVHDIIHEIKDMAADIGFSKNRAGEYRDGEKRIILYVNVLKTKDEYEETFCHELFHAFHYYYAKAVNLSGNSKFNDIELRRDLTKKVVTESLASYYEYLYCKQYGIKNDIDYEWIINKPHIYPYAGAKYIRDIGHFKSVLDFSYNLDESLRQLLSEQGVDAFYDIKNERAVSTQTQIEPYSAPANYVDYMDLFRVYLSQQAGLTKNSVDDYLSYVRKAFSEGLNIECKVLSMLDHESRMDLTDRALNKLSKSVFTQEELKTLSDRKTALNRLMTFFIVHETDLTGDINILPKKRGAQKKAFEDFAERHSGMVLTTKEIDDGVKLLFSGKISYTASNFSKDNGNFKKLFEKVGYGRYRVL